VFFKSKKLSSVLPPALSPSSPFGSFSREQVLRRHSQLVTPPKLSDRAFKDAKLYPNRLSALEGLPIAPKSVLEVGTLAGDFAEHILNKWKPNELCLIDYFNSDDHIFHEPRFNSSSHYQFVKQRFSQVNNLSLMKGESSKLLSDLIKLGKKFDFIYIDAGHTYDDVSRDIKLASKISNPGGVIGLNDYIMTDYYYDTVYGVVHATNEFLLENETFKVIGYALNENLFSDIYLSYEKGLDS